MTQSGGRNPKTRNEIQNLLKNNQADHERHSRNCIRYNKNKTTVGDTRSENTFKDGRENFVGQREK